MAVRAVEGRNNGMMRTIFAILWVPGSLWLTIYLMGFLMNICQKMGDPAGAATWITGVLAGLVVMAVLDGLVIAWAAGEFDAP